MENKHAIKIKNLHITYRTLKSLSLKNPLSKKKDHGENEDFDALKGITLDIEEGKIIGIIGRNGSGKTTLLKSIAGIFSPDKGSINLHNHSISLLSIGVGFQKQLSGYENILLSGMLIGFTEKEIKDKVDDIIAFSELGDFIYKPVKTYSSGMYSKLAFSITAILETDIMLIDEVLSVGDVQFKKKSYEKMKSLINDDKRTVIIVSHNMNTIKELCNEVIWLHEGKVMMQGKPEEVITKYEWLMQSLL